MSDTSILKFQRGLEIKLCMELSIENIEPSNTFYICPSHGLPSWTAWLISGNPTVAAKSSCIMPRVDKWGRSSSGH